MSKIIGETELTRSTGTTAKLYKRLEKRQQATQGQKTVTSHSRSSGQCRDLHRDKLGKQASRPSGMVLIQKDFFSFNPYFFFSLRCFYISSSLCVAGTLCKTCKHCVMMVFLLSPGQCDQKNMPVSEGGAGV